MNVFVCDVGGTSVKYGLFRERPATGEAVLEKLGEFPTEGEKGAADLYARILRSARQAISERPAGEPVAAIGISTTGQVNADTGQIVYEPPYLIAGYTGFDVKAALAPLGLPVYVENDVNCMAVGESASLPPDLPGDVVCLTFGTGIGGGIIRNGRLYRGAHWSAGEAGMMFTAGGYYENTAAVSALVRRIAEDRPDLADGRQIAAAYTDGDPFVRKAVSDWAGVAAGCLASIIHLLDPSALILGGGFLEDPAIFALLNEKTRALLAPGFATVLKPAAAGNQAGMMGIGMIAARAMVGAATD